MSQREIVLSSYMTQSLKALFLSSGSGGGKRLGLTPRENQALHSEWLSRFCIKLLWVISTDRFGDFVADEMIAPGKFITLLISNKQRNSALIEMFEALFVF